MLETPSSSTREQAISLREAGLSYAEIGRRLGVSSQRVWQILNPKRSKQAQDKVAPATIAMMRFSGGMMLTIRDVSQLLGVHANTVRRWSEKAILKCYRLGPRGDRRFRREDIDAFLDRKPE